MKRYGIPTIGYMNAKMCCQSDGCCCRALLPIVRMPVL